MNPTKMAEKQRFLAKTASEHPDHRFTNLYDLLHWDYWMHISAERVLARRSFTGMTVSLCLQRGIALRQAQGEL